EVMNETGESDMTHALIIDDMIDTGGSITEAAELLKKHGALTITAVATHGLFSGNCVQRLTDLPIDRVITTDSVAIPDEKRFAKLQILSAAPMLAEAIKRIHNEESISSLFEL
ncbi:MAG: phosphoribosyltransferase family protein, partial [Candidatus Neomarinimicrobiota bacterium]